jgi:fucose permease
MWGLANNMTNTLLAAFRGIMSMTDFQTSWIQLAFTKMPKDSEEEATVDVRASLRRLLKNPRYASGVIAQFFNVWAQIGVWSFTIRYVMQELFSWQCRVRCLTLREA